MFSLKISFYFFRYRPLLKKFVFVFLYILEYYDSTYLGFKCSSSYEEFLSDSWLLHHSLVALIKKKDEKRDSVFMILNNTWHLHWGRGKFWGHTSTPTVPTGEGDSAGLLPGSYQGHLSCRPAECFQRGGLLPWNEVEGGHQKPLTWRLHWRPGSGGNVVGGEGEETVSVGADAVRSGSPALAEILRWSAEVTPVGVDICAEIHPRHRGHVRTSGRNAEGLFPAGPLTGC